MGVLLPVFLAVVAYLLWVRTRINQRAHPPTPPGPKPFPVVGNISDFVTKQLWLRMTEWAHKYGDVVYLHLFGQSLVFLNTYTAATDLMERRSALYSDKPKLIMAGELCGCENMVAFTRYGDFARRQRRLLTSALGAHAVTTFRPLLRLESVALVKRLMADPAEFAGYVRRYAGELTLQSVYGYHATSNDDAFVALAEESVDILSNKIAEGGGFWLVDVFPFLRRLPMWAPGAGFKRKAVVWRKKMEEFVDRPYEWTRQRMREGTAVPCFVTTALEDSAAEGAKSGKDTQDIDPQLDFDIRWTANSMYGASIDTTLTVVLHFLRLMAIHPEVLKRAQAEVDSVVGTSRLPDFEDRLALPYLEAIMSEVLRWSVPVPFGLPHRLMEDDVYEGRYIPKGAFVFANIWNMLRDPALYPDPDAFDPARFLPSSSSSASASPEDQEAEAALLKKRDPRHAVFGFGRRRCPGAHLIEESLWIVIATVVASLDVGKARDAQGCEVEPDIRFENAVFRLPTLFKLDIRPRSAESARVVREAAEALGV